MPRPTVAEIDLAAVVHNLRALRAHITPRVEVMGMVKADAYGHGAVAVGRALTLEGVRRLAVAVVEEAVALHDAGVAGRLLVLGAPSERQAEEIAGYGFECVLSEMAFARALDRVARRMERRVPVHVKFDTGMGRIGFRMERAEEIVAEIARMPGLQLEGVMTHFAVADELGGEAYTRAQIRAFHALRKRILAARIRPPLWHCANSGATFLYPSAHMDCVRPGIALYGSYPSEEVPHFADLRPAMTLKTRIAQVRDLPPGATISYGRTCCLARRSRIAVLPIGYADGYSRANSNRSQVLVRERRAPVVGRVCMDMMMVDVTDIPDAAPNDEVVLYGRQGVAEIPIHEVARNIGTISYEIMTSVGFRVPRVYRGQEA